MSLSRKTVPSRVIFTFLITGLLWLHPTSFASASDLSKTAPIATPQNDIKKTQQILRDRGHYRGKVDGVFGLRTRASIRAFQKAENLPVTGQLDPQTAGKLGVGPEVAGGRSPASWQEIGQRRQETTHETTKGKPSAGTRLSKGSGRAGKTPKPVKTISDKDATPIAQ